MSRSGSQVRWSPKTQEGQKNLARLQAFVEQGLLDEDIGKIFYGMSKKAPAIRAARLNNGIYKKRTARHDFRGAAKYKHGEDLASRVLNMFGGSEPASGDKTLKSVLSEDDVIYYRSHPIEFARNCVRWLGKPLVFDGFQSEWITDDARFLIANKSTRIGLSFASAYKAFHKSVFNPYSRSLFVSIKEDRAKELLGEYVYGFLDGNPLFEGICRRWENLCEFNNHSKIYSLTSSPSGARGIPQLSGMDIYLDELALYKSPLDEQMFTTLMRNVVLGESTFKTWSTPFGARGKFHDVWEHADPESTKPNGFERRTYNWRQCARITPERVGFAKMSMDDVSYRQEYENDFAVIGEEVFPLALYESCEDLRLKPVRKPVSENPHYFAMDFAMGGKDMMAVVGVELVPGKRHENTFIVRYVKEYREKSPKRLAQYVEGMYNKFSPVTFFCDETGMGIPLSRMLRETIGSVVTPITFTNARKEEMVWNLVHLMRDGRVKIPHHKSLKLQTVNLGRGITPGGQPTYRHVSGKRDDLTWALLMAMSGERRRWSGVVDFGQDNFLTDIHKDLEAARDNSSLRKQIEAEF